VTRIDHIGIAVSQLEPAVEFFRDSLGLKLIEIKELPDRGLKMAFFQVGEVLVELMTPLSPDSQVSKFLETKGEGIHHIALTTPDIEKDLSRLASEGVRLATPTPSLGAEGRPIAFLHPKSTHGILLELIEKA